MKKRGLKSSFRATGQTGILITGDGVPLDAVVADFMAGSVEWLTPDNDDDHWDMIEGQGSLFHVSYSGVTMALIHGGAPDALILSHEPTRPHMRGCRATRCRRWRRCATWPCRSRGSPTRRRRSSASRSTPPPCPRMRRCPTSKAWRKRMGLPTVDPFRQGAGRLCDALEAI
jgi:hypothetical protein